MDALKKVQEAIKKFLGLGAQPATAAVMPFAFTVPEGMPEAEARRLAEEVRKAIELQTGRPMELICLGVVTAPPCDCLQCQMKRAAKWN